MLSMREIQALPARDQLYRVPLGGRLHVQVATSGVKSWVFKYHLMGPIFKDGTVTIAKVDDMPIRAARAQVALLAGQVAAGIDPVATKRAVKALARVKVAKPTVPTFASVAEAFQAGHKVSAAWAATRRWYFERRICPVLGQLPVDQVTPQVITQFLDSLSATPINANRCQAVLGRMFRWASRRVQALEGKPNPVLGHERNKETAREDRLTEAQIMAVGEALRSARPDWGPSAYAARFGPIFQLLTGVRLGVLLTARPEHLHPDEHLLRFPPDLAGVKGCRRVYLCSASIQLLPKLPLPLGREAVRAAWYHLRPEDFKGRTHDLRRTWSSVGMDLGIDAGIIDLLLGHSQGKIRDTYLRPADPTLLTAAERIGGHIAQLLGLD
jgi:integrase